MLALTWLKKPLQDIDNSIFTLCLFSHHTEMTWTVTRAHVALLPFPLIFYHLTLPFYVHITSPTSTYPLLFLFSAPILSSFLLFSSHLLHITWISLNVFICHTNSLTLLYITGHVDWYTHGCLKATTMVPSKKRERVDWAKFSCPPETERIVLDARWLKGIPKYLRFRCVQLWWQ